MKTDKTGGTGSTRGRRTSSQILVKPMRRLYNIRMDPKQGVRVWTDFMWLRIRSSGGLL
jgi:hypothetical protein